MFFLLFAVSVADPVFSFRQSSQTFAAGPYSALSAHRGALFSSDSRLRMDYGKRLSANLDFDFAVESSFQAFSGPRSPLFYAGTDLLSANQFEGFDGQIDHRQNNSTSFFSRVDRMNFNFHHQGTDFLFGRQAISLGTSHFVGVLDVLTPFATGNVNSDYKPGIDALRIQRALGATAEHEIIFAMNEEDSDSAFLYRQRTLIQGTDWEFVGGRSRGRNFAGLGFEGESGDFGLWGEGAVFERHPEKEILRSGHENFAFSAVSGFDYRVKDGLICGLGFLYQEFGTRQPRDLPFLSLEAPFRERIAQLGGQRYIVGNLHYELKPLVNLDLNVLLNMDDNSMLVQPRLSINLSNQTDLTFFSWLGFGREPQSIGGIVSTVRSEFGGINEGFGFFMRFYF